MQFRNPSPIAMMSEGSEDTIAIALWFVNCVDLIGQAV